MSKSFFQMREDSPTPYTSVDLFAGGGGLSEGFKRAGFQCLYANDSDKYAAETFRENHPETDVSTTPIEEVDANEVRTRIGMEQGDLDVLLGGPPCQGFSTYGKREEDDPRNNLYEFYIDFLKEFRPKAHLLENVTGLLSMEDGAVLDDMIGKIEDAGYGAEVWRLNSVEYGVPQHRKRIFIVGKRNGGTVSSPPSTHVPSTNHSEGVQLGAFGSAQAGNGQQGVSSAGLRAPVTVRKAISDLPDDVFVPKNAHETAEYPSCSTSSLSSYQQEIRDGAEAIYNHSAKQMLGIRRLRVALMKPGDYGTKIIQRLKEDGLPDELIDELLSENAGLRDLSQVRKQDRKKEIELRETLRKGGDKAEELIETLESGGFANKYRRLKWDEPSHTLVAHMARDCCDFVHPELDRFISVREAARLQSFPDSYYFRGSQFRQFKQIGNAVPPLLAFHLAEAISEELS